MQTDAQAANDLLGIDSDLWIAAAAIIGPLIAAIVGAIVGVLVYRFRQQVENIDRKLVVDGLQAFHTTLSGLLSEHLLNFQVATYLIRELKMYARGEPLAPSGPDLTRFIGADRGSLPISPLLPLQDLVGDKVILDWGMLALSDTTLEPKELDLQIRRPMVSYYSVGGDADWTLRKDEAADRLAKVTEAWNERISPHFALLDRLHELDREVARKRPWRMSGYYAFHRRSQVAEIRKNLKGGLAEVEKARKRVEPVLKSGGVEKPLEDEGSEASQIATST